MASVPPVSVVMPVHNGERFLAQALDSVQAQTFIDFELIVVDDASTDATAQILDEYARLDERVRIVRHDRRGMVPALNFGCAQARGTYLARMDADDFTSPQRFAEQVSFLDNHPHVAVLGAAIMVVDELDRPLFPVWYPTTDASIRHTLKSGTAFAHPAVMMRRDAFLTSGGYRTPFDPHAADYDLWLRMAEYCQFANLSAVHLRYRVHPGGVSFRDLSHQVLAMVGAETSARMRRLGQVDQFADGQPITLDRLLAMTEPGDLVLNRILELSAARCGFLVRIGQTDEALQLLRWASTLGAGALRPRARAKAGVMRSMAWQRKGSLRRSIAAGIEAVVTDPLYVAEVALRGVNVLLRDRHTRTS